MIEKRFHGPWDVTCPNFLARTQFVLTVTGSDQADSRYRLGSGFQLDVSGESWMLAVHSVGTASWRISTVFDRLEGLQVEIVSKHDAPPHLIKILCTSRDPDVNPEPARSLYDFSLPG